MNLDDGSRKKQMEKEIHSLYLEYVWRYYNIFLGNKIDINVREVRIL